MDFDNTRSSREQWREQRRKWREERRKMFERRTNSDMRGNMGIYTSGRGSGHIWTGILLLLIGCVALLRAASFPMPGWMFTWQILLIAIGFFVGLRSGFRGAAWFILMVIGGVFLIRDYFPEVALRQYLLPFGLILVGLFFIVRPHRHHRWHYSYPPGDDQPENKTGTQPNDMNTPDANTPSAPNYAAAEDYIDTTSIFGGVKKNILSKNFRGGDITNIMGGSEIDLTQSDIHGTVVIDLTQIFGGTKLIVPSNWQVKAQMAAIFGGVEDKRSVQNASLDPNKILILDGTSIFGGIEIRSY